MTQTCILLQKRTKTTNTKTTKLPPPFLHKPHHTRTPFHTNIHTHANTHKHAHTRTHTAVDVDDTGAKTFSECETVDRIVAPAASSAHYHIHISHHPIERSHHPIDISHHPIDMSLARRRSTHTFTHSLTHSLTHSRTYTHTHSLTP